MDWSGCLAHVYYIGVCGCRDTDLLGVLEEVHHTLDDHCLIQHLLLHRPSTSLLITI
jgi:hypothetical protein